MKHQAQAYQPGLFTRHQAELTEAARLLSPVQQQILQDVGLDPNGQATILAELANGRIRSDGFGQRALELSKAQAQNAADGGTQIGMFLGL